MTGFRIADAPVHRSVGASHLAHRVALFATARGVVVELGPGSEPATGLDLDGIRWVGVEPRLGRRTNLARSARLASRHTVGVIAARGEALPLARDSVDVVVCSNVLCSVQNVNAVLAEIARVLRPTGSLLFNEHTVDPERRGRRLVQRLVQPYAVWCDARCHLDRDTARSLTECRHLVVINASWWDIGTSLNPYGRRLIGIARPMKGQT